MKRNGFTLVELIITITIMSILAVATTAAINPTNQINKGKDAKMKNDMKKIKISFEEYLNDKECYPNQVLVDQMIDSTNCGKQIFSPWVANWICRPDKVPYNIVVENTPCPTWFRITTKLANMKDKDIPTGWTSTPIILHGGYTQNDVNYGVSSPNVSWMDVGST